MSGGVNPYIASDFGTDFQFLFLKLLLVLELKALSRRAESLTLHRGQCEEDLGDVMFVGQKGDRRRGPWCSVQISFAQLGHPSPSRGRAGC